MPLFSSTGLYWKTNWQASPAQIPALWLGMQLPHFCFCLVLFSELKQGAEHQPCQESCWGTSPSKHCRHSWNLLDGRREASEKPQKQTSCFPLVTLGIQKQVNNSGESPRNYLVWPIVLPCLLILFLSTLHNSSTLSSERPMALQSLPDKPDC